MGAVLCRTGDAYAHANQTTLYGGRVERAFLSWLTWSPASARVSPTWGCHLKVCHLGRLCRRGHPSGRNLVPCCLNMELTSSSWCRDQLGDATGIGMVITIGRKFFLRALNRVLCRCVPSSAVVEFPWQLYRMIAYQGRHHGFIAGRTYLPTQPRRCWVSLSTLTSRPATHTLVPTLSYPPWASGRTSTMTFVMGFEREVQVEER